MRFKQWLALALLLSPSLSQAFYLYPARSVFGLDDACRQQEKNSAIDCLFTEAVSAPEYREQLRALLLSSVQSAFPRYVSDNISAKTRNQTWVVSAEVVRASRYMVNKGATTDIFLPLTVSLKFTNILSGEVLFSRSHTEIQPASFLAADLESDATKEVLRKHYQELLKTSLENVIKEASQHFQPAQITTTVQKVWKGYVILDKGLDAGIGNNDELVQGDGSSIRVIHAEANYAVAILILGKDIHKDAVFEKIATSTRNAVRKPKALLADIHVPAGYSKNLVEQLFSDNLGDAAFTLIPINARFSQLSQAISQETELSQDHIAGLDSGKSANDNFRPLPELFLRISVAEPLVYSITSSTGEVQHRVVESRVYGDMLDNTGRVVFATQAKDRIEENIPSGIGFDTESRIEVATKNALLELAKQFTGNVKFNRFSLKVDNTQDDTFEVIDSSGQLQIGAAIKVFRQVKADDVDALIPLWEARVEQRKGEVAIARLLLPINSSPEQTLKPKSNDLVLLDSASQGGAGGLAFCKDNPNAPSSTLNAGNLPEQVYFSVAGRSGKPIYGGFSSYTGQQSLTDAITKLTTNTGFRSSVNPVFYYPQENGCLFTHYQTSLLADTCANGTESVSCDLKVNLTLVLRQLDGQGNKMTSAGLLEEFPMTKVDHQARDGVLRQELQTRTDKLLSEIVKKPLFQRQ